MWYREACSVAVECWADGSLPLYPKTGATSLATNKEPVVPVTGLPGCLKVATWRSNKSKWLRRVGAAVDGCIQSIIGAAEEAGRSSRKHGAKMGQTVRQSMPSNANYAFMQPCVSWQ